MGDRFADTLPRPTTAMSAMSAVSRPKSNERGEWITMTSSLSADRVGFVHSPGEFPAAPEKYRKITVRGMPADAEGELPGADG